MDTLSPKSFLVLASVSVGRFSLSDGCKHGALGRAVLAGGGFTRVVCVVFAAFYCFLGQRARETPG